MIAVLTETVTDCLVCGEVACERDLLYIEDDDEAAEYDGAIGDVVCRSCANEEVQS